jgi:transcriptional regulator with XRE-family HTH domain
MTKEHSDFGTWIRDCRKSRKWTQSQLAQKAFCSVETIRKIEQNRIQYRPSEEMIEKLARILEIPDDERPYFQILGRRQTKTTKVPIPVSTQSNRTKRYGFGWSKWVLWGSIIILLLGIGWLVKNHKNFYGCLIRALNKGTVTQEFTVYADEGWQNTGVCVFAGDTIEISGVSGHWTGDLNSGPQVDANGYPNSQYNWLDFTQANWGALIGAVGPRQRFLIGLGTRLEANTRGFLLLRMNDASCPDCLADNKGQINLVVTVRDRLSSQAGTTVLIDVDNGGLVLMETSTSKIIANTEHISGQHTNGGTVKAGELITVTFRVQNTETHPIKITSLVIGARGPNAQKTEWRAPTVSFPSIHDLFLQPGGFYEYHQSYAFDQLGDYFIEPVIQDALGRWGGIQPFTRIDFSVIQ